MECGNYTDNSNLFSESKRLAAKDNGQLLQLYGIKLNALPGTYTLEYIWFDLVLLTYV